jgi:hypothetical protein
MEKREGGYFVTDDEVKYTVKTLVYVSAGSVIIGVIRSLIVRISHEKKH